MIPDRIGRYQVQSVLGAGGFATVFLAHDPDLEAWVAIKVLADNMARDTDFRDRFVREARVMRQLETPGLVTVYDIGDHQGSPYFVMEYCERGTLADRIEQLGRPLSAAEGFQLAGAITSCTGHIHRAGMVHRDLKPSNYLIRSRRHTAPSAPNGNALLKPDEELAVADFGLAKVVDVSASQVSIAAGTPGYSAPEQFRGDPAVDASADVYAASAMIAAAVTGRQPTPVLAPGTTAYETSELTAAGPMAAELNRGMAIEKSHRHPDINAWYQALTTTVTGPAPSRPTMAAPGVVVTPAPAPTTAAPVAPIGAPTTAAGGAGYLNLPPPVAAGAPQPATAPPSGGPYGAPHQPTAAATPDLSGGVQAFHPSDAAATGRSRVGLLLGIGLVAVLAMGGVAALLTGRLGAGGTTAITGPTTGLVGQEAVFATTDGSTATWTVDGTQFQGRSIAIVPTSAGWVEVAADDGDSSSQLVFTATAATAGDDGSAALTINGPSVVTVGEVVVLQAVGAETGTWTIDGESYDGAAIEVGPTTAGTVTVRFEADGRTVERVLTAVEAG